MAAGWDSARRRYSQSRAPTSRAKACGILKAGVELVRAAGQPECLKAHGIAVGVLADQHEIAGVGDQHEAVSAPVAGIPGRQLR